MMVGKSVLVTGCSEGGLGDALAQEFSKRGYRVFATARNPSKVTHFQDLKIETLTLDVLSDDSIKSCVSKVSSLTGGTLDMLVNNSGGGYIMPIIDTDLTKARDLYDLNVWSLLAVTQAFLPLLLQVKGTIVNQTSIASVVNNPMAGIYNSSKAAAAMISDNMRTELAPFGIKVVDLKTGVVVTKFLENQAGGGKLPENSIYNIAKDAVEAKLDGHDYVEKAISREAYAKQVVTLVSKKNPPAQIWKGGNAGLLWFVTTFLPHAMPDRLLTYVGALDVVGKKVKELELNQPKKPKVL